MAPATHRSDAAQEDWLHRIDNALDAVIDAPRSGAIIAPDGGDGTGPAIQVRYADDRVGEERFFGPRAGEPPGIVVDRDLLLVSLGSRPGDGAEPDTETVRRAARDAGRLLRPGAYRVLTPDLPQQAITAVVDGLVSGCPAPADTTLVVAADQVPFAQSGAQQAYAARLAGLLTSAPPNVLTPERAARIGRDIAARVGLECEVLEPDDIVRQGFGGLAAIGQGSSHGPRLVRLRYRCGGNAPTLALVGKGITFDSGGLSLKPPGAQQNMRMDMAGAAVVLSVMATLGRRRPPLDVEAVLPFAENLPGGNAARPGDVVTAWDGTPIQLLDLDFEGRVILADALALAASGRPDLIIDLATLTHAAVAALGPDIGAVLGRDQHAVDLTLRAARHAGEPMWQLPWAERYRDQVRTDRGVRNHPLTDTGRALTAALFLGEFVPSEIPWAHCDIAGPSWSGTTSEDGGTGFGTRTLLSFLDQLTASPAYRSAGKQQP